MKKIKIKIEIECWQDDFNNWRYTSDDLGSTNNFCNKQLIKKIEKELK